MIRGFPLVVVVAFSAISVASSPVLASHGGGGHGGGGHMGGGHMGGGHMGGGHMGGGHMGHTGGHYSGGHYGGVQHMGGVQHHTGGVQHHMGGVQQHMGGVQHHVNSVQSGIQHHSNGIQHQSSFSGTHQHQLNSGAAQHFGSQNHPGHQNALGTQHQTHTPFYQNHAMHNAAGSAINNSAMHHNLNAMNSSIHNHSGSQFLSQHSHHQGTGINHNNVSLNHNHLGNNGNHTNHHLSNNFLANHHSGNVHSVALANNQGLHHLGNQSGFNHQHHNFANGFNSNHFNNHHNHQYLNNGGYYRHHGHGYGYGGNYWRYPYYRYGYGYGGLGYGFGLGYGLGWGLGYGLGYGGLGYWGGYGLGYGYGYGNYGYGFGGYGYGLNGYGNCMNGYGYGSSYGYPSWGCVGYQPNCAYVGYGYPSYGNYSGYGVYAGANGLNSSALAYSPLPQMSALGVATATDAAPSVVPSTVTASALDTTSGAASGLPTAEQFARIGEIAFKTRDYKGAVRAWRHGLVDDPQNAVLVMMLSQALFSTEQFAESAGAVQSAMQMLPQDKWDVVIKNFRDLYGKGEDYTTQIRALEKAAREKPDEPSLRFLLGYHYGYLGFPAEAVKQLEKCVSLAPRDEVAQKVLRVFDSKLPKKDEVPTPGLPPDSSLQSVPTPLDFVPPAPKLNPEPANASLKTAASEAASAEKPANTTP